MDSETKELEGRVAELKQEITLIRDVLQDLAFSLSNEDFSGAAMTLSRLDYPHPDDLN